MTNSPENLDPHETYIAGLADAYDIAHSTVQNLKTSINTVMGLYMHDPVTKASATLDELHSIYYALTGVQENLEDAYFTHLDAVKANPEKYPNPEDY